MQPAPAQCQERRILEERFRANLKVYFAAVRTLEKLALESHAYKKDFEQAYEDADRAKTEFEAASEELSVHMDVHGCGPIDRLFLNLTTEPRLHALRTLRPFQRFGVTR
jgi:hypothetical protein